MPQITDGVIRPAFPTDYGVIPAGIVDDISERVRADYGTDVWEFVKVETGYGRHVHDSTCEPPKGSWPGCMRHCEDSDLVIEIEYGGGPGHAVYGLKDGKLAIWMD